ncbi:MAG: isochorismatase family protein [Planctomycetota bacterium]
MTPYDRRCIDRWLRAVRPYARPFPTLRASASALLVIDMQEYFASLCKPIVATVAHAVATCRARGATVVLTQHGHSDPATDGGKLSSWWGDLIIEGSHDHQLIPALEVHPDDPIIRKKRYSAFFETELDHLLKRRGIENVAIAGVMTNLCAETTARDAFIRDYRVHVLLDATATTSEEMHVASLVNLAFGFAHVTTTAEWLHALQS